MRSYRKEKDNSKRERNIALALMYIVNIIAMIGTYVAAIFAIFMLDLEAYTFLVVCIVAGIFISIIYVLIYEFIKEKLYM